MLKELQYIHWRAIKDKTKQGHTSSAVPSAGMIGRDYASGRTLSFLPLTYRKPIKNIAKKRCTKRM